MPLIPGSKPHIRQTAAFHDFNRVFAGTLSGGILAAVPAAFYLASRIDKDKHDQSRTLLAGETVVDDTVLMIVGETINVCVRAHTFRRMRSSARRSDMRLLATTWCARESGPYY